MEIYNFENSISVHEKKGAYINANIVEDTSESIYGVLCYLEGNNIATSSNDKSITLKPIFKLLKNSKCIGITPDGPRGPNQKVSDGIIKIAKTTQVPIIPIGFASSKFKKLNSSISLATVAEEKAFPPEKILILKFDTY